MARGLFPTAYGHSPAAGSPSAAGRPWPASGEWAPQLALTLILVVGAWLLLAAFATALTLVFGAGPAAAQDPSAPPGSVTVTAPPRIGGPPPTQAPCPPARTDCAADMLDQAARLAAHGAQSDPALSVPGAASAGAAAAAGLATPAAAAQQPGTTFGKAPGYRPPPPTPPPSATGAFSRAPR
jgi:hypothetical protein